MSKKCNGECGNSFCCAYYYAIIDTESPKEPSFKSRPSIRAYRFSPLGKNYALLVMESKCSHLGKNGCKLGNKRSDCCKNYPMPDRPCILPRKCSLRRPIDIILEDLEEIK